ncbi:hypothetical protein AMAG_11635 [Allomyces macrogynus ATCC 38327]|uniref:PPPDE domain-containing protein n=1 Tax=Allomyces macrogynus (strain ATCC 38327) TaxID=578462 RepID=A0A0L0SVH4_ALLM3|nr:hypothetical protein AMAG_11635 [Allomyces macrogynus ATCC 38327]|eukprot:KNE66502.1 hypothetical protein AMAG_11635 [Allomyces macrogynus ATCC 38327]
MHPVRLLVYDLSQGMARMISMGLTGRQIDAIWHTSVLVYDREWYFGQGIYCTTPGVHHYGRPVQTIDMGTTEIPRDLFDEYLREIREQYTADKYHLLDHNCNTFTNQICQFLVGRGIPDHILGLPRDFLDTPFGQAMRPMIDAFFSSPHQPVNQFPMPMAVSGVTPAPPAAAASVPPTRVEPTREVAAPAMPTITREFETPLQWISGEQSAESDEREFTRLKRILKSEDIEAVSTALDALNDFVVHESYAPKVRLELLASLKHHIAQSMHTHVAFLPSALRVLINVTSHASSGDAWLRTRSACRTALTAMVVGGLLHESEPDTVHLALAVAFNIARLRFREAQRGTTVIWDADGSDEEWAVELVGALAHVATTAPEEWARTVLGAGVTPTGRTVGECLFYAVAGLLYAAPPAIVELLAALECTPQIEGEGTEVTVVPRVFAAVPLEVVREVEPLFHV